MFLAKDAFGLVWSQEPLENGLRQENVLFFQANCIVVLLCV